MKRRDSGMRVEKLTRDILKKRGYRILETNYRCPEGEIDIVAKHQGFLVFIEARTKTSLEFGIPEESITITKQARLRTTAARYRQAHDDLPQSWRIDVVAIEINQQGQLLRINLIENAVGNA